MRNYTFQKRPKRLRLCLTASELADALDTVSEEIEIALAESRQVKLRMRESKQDFTGKHQLGTGQPQGLARGRRRVKPIAV